MRCEPWSNLRRGKPWKGESRVGTQVFIKAKSRNWRGRKAVWTVVDQELQLSSDTKLVLILERRTASGTRRCTCRARDVIPIDDVRSPCRVTRHASQPRVPAVAWQVDHPWHGRRLAVRSPFNADYVAEFKWKIPQASRRWDGRVRLWYVEREYEDAVREMLDRYFPRETAEADENPPLLVLRSTGRGVDSRLRVGTWPCPAVELADRAVTLLGLEEVASLSAVFGEVDGKPYDSDVFSPWRIRESTPVDEDLVQTQKVGPFKVASARGRYTRLAPGLAGAGKLLRKLPDCGALWLVVALSWRDGCGGRMVVTKESGLPIRFSLEHLDWVGSGAVVESRVLQVLGASPSVLGEVLDVGEDEDGAGEAGGGA